MPTREENEQYFKKVVRKIGTRMADARPRPPSPTPQETFDQAFHDAVKALAPDMPYLMHGAGDVTQVNPATAQLVATLTVEYIGKLVDAAIDAHEMQQPQPLVTLPPPAFVRSRKPPKPAPPSPTPPQPEATATKSKDAKANPVTQAMALKPVSPSTVTLSPKKRRARDDFWDEPLPEPKIRSKRPNQDEATTSSKDNKSSQPTADDDDDAPVHVDEWVGVAGVDLFENRARAAYVQAPAALSTSSFIFPICHDVYTYGRVREIQSSRRSLLQALRDPVVADIVRQEGKINHAKTKKKASSAAAAANAAATGGNTSDPEEAEDEASSVEEDHEIPLWPGLEDILPVHQSNR